MTYRVTLSVVVDSIETANSLGHFIQLAGKEWLTDGSMIAIDPMAEASDIEAVQRVRQIAKREGHPTLADHLLTFEAYLTADDKEWR